VPKLTEFDLSATLALCTNLSQSALQVLFAADLQCSLASLRVGLSSAVSGDCTLTVALSQDPFSAANSPAVLFARLYSLLTASSPLRSNLSVVVSTLRARALQPCMDSTLRTACPPVLSDPTATLRKATLILVLVGLAAALLCIAVVFYKAHHAERQDIERVDADRRRKELEMTGLVPAGGTDTPTVI